MNILFTCAGRRNYLLKFFKSVQGVKTFACDSSVYAPALYEADDYFIVPDVYDRNYINFLFKEAILRRISAIIPLNDLELPVLAKNKKKFEAGGIKILVSDLKVINTCFDKYKTISFSANLNVCKIPTFLKPEDAIMYQSNNPDCSFVIKPRWGTASIGIFYPKNKDELFFLFNYNKDRISQTFLNKISSTDYENCILIQKRIIGQEYGIDIINNLDARYEATLIRKKISMRSGETDKAETLHDGRLKTLGKEIAGKLKHIGILDCDVIIANGSIYLLEMNPRFGGGYPFMHSAGVNLPYALTEWIRGNITPPGCFNYHDNYISAKVDNILRIFP